MGVIPNLTRELDVGYKTEFFPWGPMSSSVRCASPTWQKPRQEIGISTNSPEILYMPSTMIKIPGE